MSFSDKIEAFKKPPHKTKTVTVGISASAEFAAEIAAAAQKMGVKRHQFVEAALKHAVEEASGYKAAGKRSRASSPVNDAGAADPADAETGDGPGIFGDDG